MRSNPPKSMAIRPYRQATPSGGVNPDRYRRRRSGSGLGPVWRRGYGAKLGSWRPAGVAVLAGIYLTSRMSDNRCYRTYDRRVRARPNKKAYYTDRPQTGNLTSWTWLTATTSLGPCLHPPGGPPHGSRGRSPRLRTCSAASTRTRPWHLRCRNTLGFEGRAWVSSREKVARPAPHNRGSGSCLLGAVVGRGRIAGVNSC
jgi:hypothetical protein